MSDRPRMIMLCGVPAAGKSTWTNKYMAENGYNTVIASTDMFIDIVAMVEQKTYDEVFQDTVKDAEKAMYELVMKTVKEGSDLVWDQTNLNRKTRAKKLIMIPDHYERIAIYFPVPPDLEQRLAGRKGKTISYHVMKSMMGNFELPQLDEGFDMVYSVGEWEYAEANYLEFEEEAEWNI